MLFGDDSMDVGRISNKEEKPSKLQIDPKYKRKLRSRKKLKVQENEMKLDGDNATDSPV